MCMRKIRIRFKLRMWTSVATMSYATARPDVMYSIKNYERKVRITNILFTLTLFFKHYLCKMVL